MFLIERLWLDPTENRDAYGFEPIGCVSTKECAEGIVAKGGTIKKKERSWPLKYAWEFKGDSVPWFRYRELLDISNTPLATLYNMKKPEPSEGR